MENPVRIAGNQVNLKTLPWRKFRKRPVIISAVQIREAFTVETLEGTHLATPGSWLLQGIQGEFYAVRPDIFAQTYEEVG